MNNTKMKSFNLTMAALFLLLLPLLSRAQVKQDTLVKKLTITELFHLAEDNNTQIKIARAGVGVAGQRVNVSETQKNPVLTATAGASYLGDATVMSNDFSQKINVPMPHFGNSFAVQASQLVFKGGAIKHNIAVSGLQEQLAQLSYEKNSMDIKLLLVGNYFDLFKLYNQQAVYRRNIELAQVRKNNIGKMYKQGMVTRNDLIRNDLLITNLNTALKQINNNITILNQSLDIALGLPENTLIVPDSTVLDSKPELGGIDGYLEYAYQNYPDIKSAAVSTEMAQKGISIAKADRLPAASLNAGNSLARPITTSSPARDVYSNGWQAGVGISFNISSLYNSKENIKLAKMQLAQQQQTEILQKQNTEIAVKSAFIKHQEAYELKEAAEKSRQLAEENFRIVEKKYLNQMAILTDLLDATNAKLEAELQETNSEISILYTHYQLQKAVGHL